MKPERLSINFRTIPDELTHRAQWILWNWEKRDGKWTKPPYRPDKTPASSANPSTWISFDKALEAYKSGTWDGIGFVISKDDPYCGFDWDNCRNKETGNLRDWARSAMKRLNSYSEISPSMCGCKTLVKGKLPSGGHHNEQIGVFDSGRYFCITGNLVNGFSPNIEHRQTELDTFIKEHWPEDLAPPQRHNGLAIQSTSADNAVIEKMLGAKNGEKILKLMDGKWEGIYQSQSEADQALCNHIAFWTKDPTQIDRIIRQSGLYRDKWEREDYRNRTIQRAIAKTPETYSPPQDISARVREYLLDEFDGGVFKLSDLRRELGLDDRRYTAARMCVKRMVNQGLLQKHGHQLGCYRVVDRKKVPIDWAATEAQASRLILPGNLHRVVTLRDGDMVAFAGYKNHNKTGIALESVRLNLDSFKVHLFITEYRARMKRRLLDFGINLNHPNLNAYQIEKSDYIPDKIEGGQGVLNVIDHYPNLDNFYLVGKHMDEIHRALDGAICIVTHQKKNPDDLDAIGGSFWTITPTLAVTLFWNDEEQKGRMQIRKGKEPAPDKFGVNGLSLAYTSRRGCEFKFDPTGWK
jgi:hypothetical protein